MGGEPVITITTASLTYASSGTYNIPKFYNASGSWTFNAPKQNGKYPVMIGFKQTAITYATERSVNSVTENIGLSYTHGASTFTITYSTSYTYGNKGPKGTLFFVFVD